MKGGGKLGKPRESCLFCTNKVSKSALDTITCCKKCAAMAKANVFSSLSGENPLSKIHEQTGLPMVVLTELLHRIGVYGPEWITENAPTLESLRDVSLIGVRETYNRPGKNKDRAYILEAARKLLGDRPVAMLSLPHVALICYVDASKVLNLVPARCVLVERETTYSNILNSWVAYCESFADGAILRNVTIFKGTVAQALKELPQVYNFVNLDFLGPWTNEVERTVRRIFRGNRLEDESFVSITLSEAARFAANPQYELVERRHRDFVIEKFKELAKGTSYTPIYLWHHNYNEATSYPMITIVFRIRKKAS